MATRCGALFAEGGGGTLYERLLERYFSAAKHICHVGIVDAAELAWGYALYGLGRVDDVTFGFASDSALHEVVDVAYFEGDVHLLAFGQREWVGDIMEVCQTELVTVL